MLRELIVGLIFSASITACLATPRVAFPISGHITRDHTSCAVGDGEFGIFDEKNADPAKRFQETSVVPLKAGQAYGWFLHVTPDQANVHWKEEFILPAQPKEWGGIQNTGEETQKVDNGRKVCVTEKDVVVTSGMIYHAWSVIAGDPPGKYTMKISVNGKLVKTFEFRVEPIAQRKEVR